MAKRRPLQKSDPVGTLEDQLNQDFNDLIRDIHKNLSTKKHSPVYTGFFASSWKVQTMAVNAVEKAEDHQPWKGIKRIASEYFFENKRTMPANQVPHKIEMRYPVKKTFNFKKPVFIGNRAKYAAYALENPKVATFIQGSLGKLIKQNMKEKKGKLFIASRRMGKFGSFKGGPGYSEINLKDYQ
tara:strand:- start:908 stop:1459 length:552 start_codon:yes stop_codon:yes gene_type:complete